MKFYVEVSNIENYKNHKKSKYLELDIKGQSSS